ncbi:MaoC family dehydratase N-terminal domain-containing protein [Paraburkholderia sediminicola]|uniref:FAS1-like dehydratase domain-containing protein n=1 Tax=Paraburkholderia sediminicola TaxID=458836 RepID=UPI0038B9C36A
MENRHEPTLDLSPYLDVIGKEFEQPEQFNYEVTRDSIRHFAHSIDDYNALYLDADFASSTKWKGIIAPPGYLMSHGHSAWIIPRLPKLQDPEGEELNLFAHAADDWTFLKPARPGNFIRSSSRLASADLKSGRKMGTSVLLRFETVFFDQYGEKIATRGGQYFVMNSSRGGPINKSPYPPLPDGGTRNVIQPTRFPGSFSLPAARRDSQRYYEDVNVGDELPILEIPPVMLQNLGRFNAATIGTGVDEVGGEHDGMPDAYVFGHLRISWFARLILNWAGPNSWIHQLTQRNRQWLLIGFRASCAGVVKAKGMTDGEAWVDIDLTCDCELGFVTNAGTARVVLPLRHSR